MFVGDGGDSARNTLNGRSDDDVVEHADDGQDARDLSVARLSEEPFEDELLGEAEDDERDFGDGDGDAAATSGPSGRIARFFRRVWRFGRRDIRGSNVLHGPFFAERTAWSKKVLDRDGVLAILALRFVPIPT